MLVGKLFEEWYASYFENGSTREIAMTTRRLAECCLTCALVITAKFEWFIRPPMGSSAFSSPRWRPVLCTAAEVAFGPASSSLLPETYTSSRCYTGPSSNSRAC